MSAPIILKLGTTYFYNVVVKDEAQNKSIYNGKSAATVLLVPAGLTYSSTGTYTKGILSTNSPTSSGGTIATYTVSPALPAGLILNTTTGVITGTPTAVTATASYTVTATNAIGTTTAILNITVNEAPPPNPVTPIATASSTTQITLSWTSSGESTSDYRIAYQIGLTAPTNCASGTQIGEGAITGTSHTVTGLAATTYSFRICAINANTVPDVSSGVTISGTLFSARFISLAGGIRHGCGLMASGDVYCWGYNNKGQLGNGSTTTSQRPAVAVAGSHRFTSITARNFRSCGLKASGDAYCWGDDLYGGLGDGGTATDSPVPVAVAGSHKFTSITTGDVHSCGLTSNGDAYCWGIDTYGGLGDGGLATLATSSQIPVAVTGGYKFTLLTTGGYHSCGLTDSGDAYCWGYNSDGELGNGSTTNSPFPTLVGGGYKFTSLTAGGTHSCGLTDSGVAYCWGYDAQGQLGDGAPATDSQSPVAVAGGHIFTSLTTGDYLSCGLTDSGAAYCWGYGAQGQLGNNSTTSSQSPVAVTGGYKFTSLTARSYHSCGLTASGVTYCWGYGLEGQLGNNSSTNSLIPVAVDLSVVPAANQRDFRRLTAGGSHSCGLTATGAAHCWGLNTNGQLGDSSTTTRLSPVAVTGSLIFSSLSTGSSHSCGIRDSGDTYCWGLNTNGQLGDGGTTPSSSPVLVAGGYKFTSLSTGDYHSCGLTASGTVHCWGLNTNGQLGDGGTTPSSSPVAVTGGLMFRSLSAGSSHSCGLTASGLAHCWGLNSSGQLGNSTTTTSSSPVAVTQGGLVFSSLSAGSSHSCGLTSSGVAHCWGLNASGQLGNNSTTTSSSPVAVTGSLIFGSLSASSSYSCGLTDAGLAYCWGGQPGNNSLIPVTVSGSGIFASLRTGSAHSCGLTDSGTSYCWGFNTNGQLGNGSTTDALLTPVATYPF